MASIGNLRIYGTAERIKALHEEHRWIGRHVTRIVNDNTLIIYSVPPKKKKKKPVEGEEEKSAQRRVRRGNGYNRHKEIE